MALCGQKDRLPHLTGGGNLPSAMPAHHVEGETPTMARTSGKGRRGSGVDRVSLDLSSILRASIVIEPL